LKLNQTDTFYLPRMPCYGERFGNVKPLLWCGRWWITCDRCVCIGVHMFVKRKHVNRTRNTKTKSGPFDGGRP